MSEKSPTPAVFTKPHDRGPAGFRLIRTQTLELSRERILEIARDHLQLPESPTERALEPRRVKELLERIKCHWWLPCNWATVIYHGTKYRMNGHHSAEALIQASDSLPQRCVIHLDDYEADDAIGMGTLFRQFDARFSMRSKLDISGAYQGLVDALRAVNKKKAKLGMDGIGWYRRSIEGLPAPTGEELYEWLMSDVYHPFLRWLDGIISVKTAEMNRVPVVGALYGTFIISASGAQEFWSHVAKNDVSDDADARSVLSQDLQRAKEENLRWKPAEYYAKCIKAWNAFRRGEKIKTLVVNPKKGLPEIAA